MIKRVFLMIFMLLISTQAFAGDLQYLQPPQLDLAQQSREEWENTFHFDVWAPYFYFLNIEDCLKQKLQIKIGIFQGKPEFNYKQKQVIYRFKLQF